MLMSRSLGLMAVVLLAACRNLEAPAPSQQTQLVVHGVLDSEATSTGAYTTVLLYRARTGLPRAVEGGGVSDDEPVADAAVSISGPDGRTVQAGRFAEPSGECCVPGTYVFDRSPRGLPLTPGAAYTLRIRTPLGEEVTGTTIIPDGPSLAARPPLQIFFRLRDTLRLNWPRVPGATSYEVIIRRPRFEDEYRTFSDTSFTIAGTALTIAGDEIFQSGEDADVDVSAVDVNYYDYYRSQSDPFAGAAPGHLTGAVGVFGSVAPISHMVLRVR
jgi:hypothetical protein